MVAGGFKYDRSDCYRIRLIIISVGNASECFKNSINSSNLIIIGSKLKCFLNLQHQRR